ncbi:MAG: hypothetical protein CVV53_01035 [Spirochaetae bacterium HGW-Spirochaetae-9]|nr:MAG: hypothetical protein CVV53_01035 [Spirochaetae bacterium HGW-Spirochaetae-9]
MNKTGFYLAYFLSPIVPIAFYFATLGWPINLYGLSVSLGIAAFMFLCGQFMLASRPAWAIKALGLKNLTHFHSTMPIVIVGIAVAHRISKQIVGLDTESTQADFGAAVLLLLSAVIVFTVLLMATTFWQKLEFLKKFKAWVYEKTGLDYKKSRVLHNLTLLIAPLLLIHVLLASSSDFAANPIGFFVMIAWMLIWLGMYLRYRMKGRSIDAGKVPLRRADAKK